MLLLWLEMGRQIFDYSRLAMRGTRDVRARKVVGIIVSLQNSKKSLALRGRGASLELLVGCRVGSEGEYRNSLQILRKDRVSDE